ncbi:probable RNA-directed DNA polymerase from transposon X-element isoform X3 [Temnothorax longispinosus]|uniref:probable RNA-directed DNA polymerase from transposon X-element isoform X3 n=1 Tax=Temnothorax longispinosus TaxID=300112 RepID=UPI003A99FE8E
MRRIIVILLLTSAFVITVHSDKLSSLLKNVIIDEQHGFVAKRSTSTNLLLYHDYFTSAIEEGYQVDAIYTDFKKAFDSVEQDLLIKKLRAYGLDGAFLRWLSSFIIDKTQTIKFRNFFSRIINATSGVPQGSHLGPLLFNLFINDIIAVFKHCGFLLFADDLKVYRRIINILDAILLQLDLDRLSSWCNKNKLYFNLSKCHVIHFNKKKKNALKCYMCTSLSNEGCGSNLTTKLQPMECTVNNIQEWQRSIQQHNGLKSVASFFEVDEIFQHYQDAPQEMACAKMMIFNNSKIIPKQDVIIRTCQRAKTEHFDPCKTMEDKLNDLATFKMEQCTLCFKDACNSTMFLSSEIFYIFLSLFCTFIVFYC